MNEGGPPGRFAASSLLPAVAGLSTVVTGGDRRTVDAILADPRLAPVAALRAGRFLEVHEPRKATLELVIPMARAVRLLIHDPPQDPAHR